MQFQKKKHYGSVHVNASLHVVGLQAALVLVAIRSKLELRGVKSPHMSP